MKENSTITSPPSIKPEVDTEVLTTVKHEQLDDSYVYVHCYFNNTFKDMLIRIWKATFLIDRFSGARSSLVHTENISFAPQWTMIPDQAVYNFLLVFTGLPSTCKVFDLVEEIPEPGGFFVQGIQRNETDIYHIDI
ncbi:MAG: hypothetical protein L0Y35_08670 [Flammeovirgaceae bacterium]|nr:hypothetical protein [Flammeovirgaceae bacterium]